MTIKVTVPNTSNDSLTFGSANTPTAAQVVGIDSGSSNGQLAFNTTASGTSTERMRIDASGNVGIGTSSPNQKLESTGTIRVSRAGTPTTYMEIFGGDGSIDPRINVPSGFGIPFNVNGSEKARIDSSGRLLVGLTSVPTTGNVDGTAINAPYAGDTCSLISAETSTSNSYRLVFLNANGFVGSINTSGSSTSYNTSSDYRLKEAITPMTGALDKVALLKPCTYTWKSDGSDGQGFIAHELAEVEAGCVTGEKDAVDADGNPKYQGIDTSFLVATLTAAIQEQQALITQQAAALTTLTERITALEAK